jgi:tetratricopeptide (TPR) repeat protein
MSSFPPQTAPRRATRGHFAPLLPLVALCWVLATAAPSTASATNKATEAAAISHVAHGKATSGKWTAAAELYMQAYRTDPKVLGYLRSGATSYFKAGAWQEAIDTYELLLDRLPNNDEGRVKARERLATCRQRVKKESAKAEQQQLAAESKRAAAQAKIDRIEKENEVLKAASAERLKEVEKHKASVDDHKQNAAKSQLLYTWLLTGVGVVAAGAGGFLAWDGGQRGSELEADLQKRDAGGKIINLDHEGAVARQDGANMRIGVGIGLATVGVAACATALFQHLSGPKTTTLAPTLAPTMGGATLLLRF